METPPACAGGLGGGQVGAMGGKKQLPGPRMGPGASLGLLNAAQCNLARAKHQNQMLW